MVRNNTQREATVIAIILMTAQLLHPMNNVAHNISIIVAINALKNRGYALQAHTSINTGARQRSQYAVLITIVLHENQIPNLHPAVTVAFTNTAFRGITSIFLTSVKKDL